MYELKETLKELGVWRNCLGVERLMAPAPAYLCRPACFRQVVVQDRQAVLGSAARLEWGHTPWSRLWVELLTNELTAPSWADRGAVHCHSC
jgi:hypothetical protein